MNLPKINAHVIAKNVQKIKIVQNVVAKIANVKVAIVNHEQV